MTPLRDLDKRALLSAVLEKLQADADAMRASAKRTKEGATHEEAKPENDKDTRATEASYLARGFAQRFEELEDSIKRLKFMDVRAFSSHDAIGPSALVSVDVDGEEQTYFIATDGGGTKVVVGQRQVLVVTPASPVGRALLRKHVGDDFELRVASKRRDYEIVDVA